MYDPRISRTARASGRTIELQCLAIDALRTNLADVVSRHGLCFFMIGLFPNLARTSLADNLITTNWPEELIRKYEQTDMFRASRIIQGLKKTILPVFADSLLFARARENGVKSTLLGIFYDPGFRKTIGLSLHDAHGVQYMVMLSGNQEIETDADLSHLLFDIMKALDLYAANIEVERADVHLADREIQCLQWAAAGKTSEEIAVILEISSHTVNAYLQTAIKKLDCVTRVQAVARAVRLRLI